MADGFSLLDYFQMGLVVGSPRSTIAVRPSHIEHKFSEIEITGVSGCPVEFGQAHCRDLVTRPDRLLTRTECSVEKFRGPERDVEQRPFPRCLIVGDSSFIKVPQIVQFMTVNLLEFPTFCSCPVMWFGRIDRPGRIEVAVFFLRGCDLFDQAVNVSFKLWVRMDAQCV